MGGGVSAQSRGPDGCVQHNITFRHEPCLLRLRHELCEIVRAEDEAPAILLSLYDIASWTSTPSSFCFNIDKIRPVPNGFANHKAEFSFETYEAAVIAASVRNAAHGLKAQLARLGLNDKEVRGHVQLQQEEFVLEEVRRYAQTRQFTCLQAAWIILSCDDRFVRLDVACLVLPRLLHMETVRWTVHECFEDQTDWSNLQVRLKGLLSQDAIATIALQ